MTVVSHTTVWLVVKPVESSSYSECDLDLFCQSLVSACFFFTKTFSPP